MNKITIGLTYIKLTRAGRTYIELRLPGTNPNQQVERLIRHAQRLENRMERAA